jgi:hypothetical protein
MKIELFVSGRGEQPFDFLKEVGGLGFAEK